MKKRKRREAARGRRVLEGMTHYVNEYRPAEASIPPVDEHIWTHMYKMREVPADLHDKLQYDPAIKCVRQAPHLVRNNDTFVSGLLSEHFAPKLVGFTIMDYMDSTSDRCRTCHGTIQVDQRTPCTYCGKYDRLIHSGCYVDPGSQRSLCGPCSKCRVWCVDCESWIERRHQSICSCEETIHRDCLTPSSIKSYESCAICGGAHHLTCFETDQQFCDGCLVNCAHCHELFHKDCGDFTAINSFEVLCGPCIRSQLH